MTVNSATWRVGVDADVINAAYDAATTEDAQRAVFVCAHGAGGHMADPGMLRISDELTTRGIGVVRFNFVYSERKSGRPDPMPRLEACVAAVVARARDELKPRLPILGGRSMGGRAASMLVAHGFQCDGLLLLAYPLHPAGRLDQLRDAHLPLISVPVLCLNGTRDALCTPTLMQEVLTTVRTRWTMHWLQGADHSFHVLKSSGRTDADVMTEIGDVTATWVKALDQDG
jgi:predicted alpha/beta-hydrolase family hydrolase